MIQVIFSAQILGGEVCSSCSGREEQQAGEIPPHALRFSLDLDHNETSKYTDDQGHVIDVFMFFLKSNVLRIGWVSGSVSEILEQTPLLTHPLFWALQRETKQRSVEARSSRERSCYQTVQ